MTTRATTRRRALYGITLALCIGSTSCAHKGGGGGGGKKNRDNGNNDQPLNLLIPKDNRGGTQVRPYPQQQAQYYSGSQDRKGVAKKAGGGGGGGAGGYYYDSGKSGSSDEDGAGIILTRGPNNPRPKLVWHDEFIGNGPPDPAFWSVAEGSDVFTAGHLLSMSTSSDSQQATSSHLTTSDRVTFTYGTLEARIKVPDMTNSGIQSTFWTLGVASSAFDGWPSVGEVTIMEMGYNQSTPSNYMNHRVRSSVHYTDGTGSHDSYSKVMTGAIDLSQDFHTYRLEWTPETMTTYVDDRWLWEIVIDPYVCGDACSELHSPHSIHLNLAVGGRFRCMQNCGRFARGEMLVDYVRLFDNGYTVGTVNGFRSGWYRYGGVGGVVSKGGFSKGSSFVSGGDGVVGGIVVGSGAGSGRVRSGAGSGVYPPTTTTTTISKGFGKRQRQRGRRLSRQKGRRTSGGTGKGGPAASTRRKSRDGGRGVRGGSSTKTKSKTGTNTNTNTTTSTTTTT